MASENEHIQSCYEARWDLLSPSWCAPYRVLVFHCEAPLRQLHSLQAFRRHSRILVFCSPLSPSCSCMFSPTCQVFVSPDYDKYTVVAEKIRAIFREYDPRMRSYSLDEALLNVTDYLIKKLGLDQPAAAPAEGGKDGPAARVAPQAENDDTRMPERSAHAPESHRGGGSSSADADISRRRETGSVGMGLEADDEDGDGEEEEEGGCGVSRRRKSPRDERRARARLFEAARALAEEIRGRIKEATKLTASVGIGPNFMLAKVRDRRRLDRHLRGSMFVPAFSMHFYFYVSGGTNKNVPVYKATYSKYVRTERCGTQTNALPPHVLGTFESNSSSRS